MRCWNKVDHIFRLDSYTKIIGSFFHFFLIFIYLGVFFIGRRGGAAYAYREEKGRKALGAIHGYLQTVRFLPIARTVELGEALVGGAYLYGAEMWAPFIWMVAAAEGSRDPVNIAYLKWIMGLVGARLERRWGWTPVRRQGICRCSSSFGGCGQISRTARTGSAATCAELGKYMGF